jgi:hypothetical protein
MDKRMKKNVETAAPIRYVAVALAEEVELARDYVEMLRNNEVPSRFIVSNEVVDGGHVTIVVAEEFLAQAQSLIQARNSASDFYEDIYNNEHADQFEEKEE